jgi:hypothetical protein
MPEIAIYADSRGPGHCRSCGAAIEWAETIAGKRIPFDVLVVVRTQPALLSPRLIAFVNTVTSPTHFERCPQAKEWRRR